MRHANRLKPGLQAVHGPNAHDVRLTFRWPLLPSGDTGDGRQTFRTLAGGQMVGTNNPAPGVLQIPLYLLQPATYIQAR